VRTILVVDDEYGIADALKDILGDEGYAVTIARNGRDALKEISVRTPDLILLDYMMPIMDGRDFWLALKANPETQNIPVAMMSAMPQSSIPSDCRPDAFLRKPFDLDSLFEVVRSLLK
jgi:CheY-like chemotaxis protein